MKLAALTRIAAAREARPPRLADGVELLGEYAGSGFREPPGLARRADGCVLQLSRMAYLVAAAVDGRRGMAEIAERVSEECGRRLASRDVEFLLERKLAPAGVVAADGPAEVPPGGPAPLALTAKTGVVPPPVVGAVSACFRPLFRPGVVGAVLAWLVALDAWILFEHGVARSAAQLVHRPILVLAVFGLVVFATVLHEFGHAAACRYGGARPGAMGVGLYLVWPVFYTNVTDAYRLDRRGRLRTDLGGVYFNSVFAVACGALFLLTGFEPLVAVIAIQHVQILQQLTPFGRLDGYYVLTDLAGVPDILSRIGPTLRSLVPGRDPEPRVAELRPWVRGVVSAYVLTVVPLVVLFYALLVVHAPGFFARIAASFRVQLAAAGAAFGDGHAGALALALVQMLVLALPALAVALLLARTARWLLRLCWRRLTARPRLLAAATFAAGVAAAVPALLLVAPGPGVAKLPEEAVVRTVPARHAASHRPRPHTDQRTRTVRAPVRRPALLREPVRPHAPTVPTIAPQRRLAPEGPAPQRPVSGPERVRPPGAQPRPAGGGFGVVTGSDGSSPDPLPPPNPPPAAPPPTTTTEPPPATTTTEPTPTTETAPPPTPTTTTP
jgi:putative peptide zinc metalloprotease protein